MTHKLDLGRVKAPAVEFPQVGLYFEHRTHLRELNSGGFDAVKISIFESRSVYI